MLSGIAAEMQQLVGNGTQLQRDVVLLVLFDKMRVLEQRISMSNALGIQQKRIIEIAVLGVVGTAGIEQGFSRVEHEWDFHAHLTAGLREGEQEVGVVGDVVWSVFCAYEIEAAD